MDRSWEKRLRNFDRVWERVRGAPPPPPPPPGRWPPPPPPPERRPPPPPPPKRNKGGCRASRFCPRGFW